MGKPNNVKIPLGLLVRAIDLLENIDLHGYDISVQCEYDAVYFALLKKHQDIELREAYAKIVYAKDEETRFKARINYLQRKHLQEEEPF